MPMRSHACCPGISLLLFLVVSASARTLEQQPLACDADTLAQGTCTASTNHVLLQRGVLQGKAVALHLGGAGIVSGDRIFLTGHTGRQLTVQDGRVHAHWQDRHDWQTFIIEKDAGGNVESGDSVYLKADNGNYLTAEGEQIHALWPNEHGTWQQFIIEKRGSSGAIHDGDLIFLRAHTTKRITVMPEGDVDVHASWDHQGEWQALTIEKRAETTPSPTPTPAPTGQCSPLWGQCGGLNWDGPSCCEEGAACRDQHDYHSMCEPVSSPSPTGTPAPTTASTTQAPSTSSTASPTPVPIDSTWTRGTWTTGYWDCCKPSCSWPGKGRVDQPVRTCQAGTGFPLEDHNEPSVCHGGSAASCANNQPFAYSSNLSFGFAAAAVSGDHGLTGDDNCGQCYELRFVGGVHPNGGWGGSHSKLVGKTMIIQVTNIGYDVSGHHSFDLQIPGAGQGAFSDGCTAQFEGFSSGDFDCDNLYGGCHTRGGCDRLPLALQAGCQWRYDWYHWLEAGGKTNNPYVDFRRVRCPEQIIAVTGSTPLDDESYPTVNPTDY